MSRTLVVLLAGVAVGSAATFVVVRQPQPGPPAIGFDTTSAPAPERDASAAAPGRGSVADRAAYYARVASAGRADLIELARAAAETGGDERRFRLDALLARYAELAPAEARGVESELRAALGREFLEPFYTRWAERDPDAALASLADIGNEVDERTAAFAILRVLDDDERAVERVARALRLVDASRFRTDAVMVLAQSGSKAAALRAALALPDPTLRKTTAERVVTTWALEEPAAAMAAIERVGDTGLRSSLQLAVLRNWRDGDDLFLAYLPRLDDATRAEGLRTGLLQRVARADPRVAADLAAELPLGPERFQRLTEVIGSFAAQDPEAALAWARSIQPPEPGLVGSAMVALAGRDPLRAFDLAQTFDPAERAQALQAALSAGQISGAQGSALASRILGLAGPERANLLQMLLASWSYHDPESALDWLAANAAQAPPQAFAYVAQRVAQTDPARAEEYLTRVPREVRGEWLQAVTQGYAMRSDTQGALTLLSRYRGDPAYDTAASGVAVVLAQSDPAQAAQLLTTLEGPAVGNLGTWVRVGQQWAQRDPAAATAWAVSQPAEVRTPVLASTLQMWSMRDPAGARDWTLSLPAGQMRDAAIGAMTMAAAANPASEIPDAALLNALSTDAARQQVVAQSLILLARRDPAAARRLADTYVTDPNMRAATDRMLAAAASNPAMVRDPRFPTMQGPTSVIIGPNGTPVVVPTGPIGQTQMLNGATGTVVIAPPGMVAPPPPPRSPERGRPPPRQ